LRGDEWKKITLAPKSPPDGAYAVRLVALVRGGRAWFDDFDLLHLQPNAPLIRIFANQVGYELAGPKSAIVATNFFPTDIATLSATLVDAQSQRILEAKLNCRGRIHGGLPDDWGWYFWRF